ncbi:MAG: DUF3817 domain-containing protein [Myxococcota bacterium]
MVTLSTWLLWKWIKLTSVVVFAGGVFGTLSPSSRASRLWIAHWVMTPSWVLVWISGFWMMKTTGRPMSTMWILTSLFASYLTFHATVMIAYRREQPKSMTLWMAIWGLFASLSVMVTRPIAWKLMAIVLGVSTLLSLPFVIFFSRISITDDVEDVSPYWTWFQWIARLEGLSLLLMLFVSMPLKYAFQISLDRGTGLVGWTHGVLLLVFMQSLVSSGRYLGWSWKKIGVGFLSSMVPFGTFVFEFKAR